MNNLDPTHYGPYWRVPRPPIGESLALCRPGPLTSPYQTLTTFKPWVTCAECLKLLKEQAE